jgi:mono/diheme cytochrome c family protein
MVLVGIFLMQIYCKAEAPVALQRLREQVRTIALSRECVRCHTPNGSGATRKILSVYNLENKYWSATMRDEQLQAFLTRMTDKMSPIEKKELGIDPAQLPLTKQEVKTIKSFVKTELEFRRTHLNERQREILANTH